MGMLGGLFDSWQAWYRGSALSGVGRFETVLRGLTILYCVYILQGLLFKQTEV